MRRPALVLFDLDGVLAHYEHAPRLRVLSDHVEGDRRTVRVRLRPTREAAVISLLVHTVVGIYWLVLDIPMVQIVLLYGLPALGSSLQLFYFGTFRPHCHEADDAAGFADRHNTRSEDFGTLASLASCFHFGYHLEHHRRPDVPWWALPAARRAGVGQTDRNAKVPA